MFVVTESSTGPIKRFNLKEMTVAHVGVHGSSFPGSPLSGTLLSYGASTVAQACTSFVCVYVCVYYCRTYYKAVRGGGRRRVDDMCMFITA